MVSTQAYQEHLVRKESQDNPEYVKLTSVRKVEKEFKVNLEQRIDGFKVQRKILLKLVKWKNLTQV